MKVECYAATATQDGRRANEDASLIVRGDPSCIALCDGAGDAKRAAHRALQMFEKQWKTTERADLGVFATWARWARGLDANLLGGAQSTFVAVGVFDDKVVGTCCGDSRLYVVSRDGQIRIASEGASKARLGSGEVDPFPLFLPAERGDLLMLMSDGAWTPLSLYVLKKVVARGATRHLSELPPAILAEAGKNGRADDMTVVVARIG